MLIIALILISIVCCMLAHKYGLDAGFTVGKIEGLSEGKTEGLREGSATIVNVVKTMTEVLETNNKHNSETLDRNYAGSVTLSNTWQTIVGLKDKQIENYIKENVNLKNALEHMDDEFTEVDDEEEEDEVTVAAGANPQPALFHGRSAATTALELHDQMLAANITLDNIKNSMSPESYRVMKELLQVPGVTHDDRKSGN